MHCCCNDAEPAPQKGSPTPSSPGPSPRCRVAAFVQWALPVTTLALIPKCPGCVAAYVLLFTGMGISLPAAAATRWALIALSISALGYLVFRAARRVLMPAP